MEVYADILPLMHATIEKYIKCGTFTNSSSSVNCCTKCVFRNLLYAQKNSISQLIMCIFLLFLHSSLYAIQRLNIQACYDYDQLAHKIVTKKKKHCVATVELHLLKCICVCSAMYYGTT